MNSVKNNSNISPQMPVFSGLGNPDSMIIKRLFGILKADDAIMQMSDTINCSTATGIICSLIFKEEMHICLTAQTCCSQITYEEINKYTATLQDMINYYTSSSEMCKELRDSYAIPANNCCPLDNTIIINYNGFVGMKNMSEDSSLVWIGNICTTADLLNALICKLNHLAKICEYIMGHRKKISSNPDVCESLYKDLYSANEEFVIMAAHKTIADADLSNPNKKKKYIDKILNRYNNNKMCTHASDTRSFAYYIANTQGINKVLLYNFLIDGYILKNIGGGVLEFPWVIEDYRSKIDDIMQLLKLVYEALRRKGHSSTHAYAIIFIWLKSHIKIASGYVSAYTRSMNKLTSETHDEGSISNVISKLNEDDYSDVYPILDTFADSFNIRVS